MQQIDGQPGKAELSHESFAELDDGHHLGHVDAAFRMPLENSTDHMFFFLVQLTPLCDDVWDCSPVRLRTHNDD